MNFSITEFYKQLEYSLPTSTSHKRKLWVNKIIVEDIEIKEQVN